MARDVFQMTLSTRYPLIDMPSPTPDVEDVLQALEGIQISVFKRGTTTSVDAIFQRPTGATQGPTPESGATGGPNPFTTGPSGQIEFWCDGPAEIDVFVHDTVTPARMADRTYGWNAIPAAPASIPGSMMAQDASLTLAALAADVTRQMHQIGEVIDWWRPDVSVPIPSGFEICIGQQIPAGQHDFPGLGASAINLPDLRNRFILGADSTKALAAGAGQGNASADAPGIAGTGGSNAAKDFSHGHGVPGVSHVHYVRTPDHTHSSGFYTGNHSHSVSGGTGGEFQGALGRQTGTGNCAPPGHTHGVSGTAAEVGNLGVYGSTGALGGTALYVNSDGPNVSLNTATNSTAWTADPGTDMRPRFYGLLKLMKVRRS